MTPAQHKAASWPWQPVIDADYRVVRARSVVRGIAALAATIGGADLFMHGLNAASALVGWHGVSTFPLWIDALLIGGIGAYYLLRAKY